MRKKTLKVIFKDIELNVNEDLILIEKDWEEYKEDLENSFIVLTNLDRCDDWKILDFKDTCLEGYIIHVIIATYKNKTYSTYFKELIRYF